VGSHGEDGSPPPIRVVVLSKYPAKKAITERYKDGHTLTLVFYDDKLIEKMIACFRWDWDYEKVREEKEKGETVSFKYWVSGGLDVRLRYVGSYLFGKTFALDFSKVSKATLVAEDWRVEVNNDIAFLMIDI
jgi:hypothetical protein